jgi:hypothetical protein
MFGPASGFLTYYRGSSSTPLLYTPMSTEQHPSSIFLWPIIDKSPPRPAPTKAYSWKECNPRAKLLYIRDHAQANEALSNLDVSESVLGFDIEWKPIYYKGARENPVALVQLASYDTVLLLQIRAMKGRSSNLLQVYNCNYFYRISFQAGRDPSKLRYRQGRCCYTRLDLCKPCCRPQC